MQAVADEQEAERVAMASIDWHDFTVVETIEFDAAEDEELPPPMVLKDVIQMVRQLLSGMGDASMLYQWHD